MRIIIVKIEAAEPKQAQRNLARAAERRKRELKWGQLRDSGDSEKYQ